MVLIKSRFHTRNNLSENILQFGHAPLELFGSPILGRKSLKNIGLKWRRIIRLPGAPTSWTGPGCVAWVGICLPTFRDSQRGTARTFKRGTDGLFHNSVTHYQPTSRSVPVDRCLISHIYYQMHGSQSFLTTYQPFK
jgi:hypothetical protein